MHHWDGAVVSCSRDPRTGPLPGDEICKTVRAATHGVIFREVVRAHGGVVFYLQDNGFHKRPRCVTLQDWIRWADDTEIIKIEGVQQ